MREITETIKVYTFDELDEEAQERAINNEREVTLDYEWWEWIIEDLQEQCAKLGIDFETDDIRFDLGRGAYLFVYSNELSLKWKAEVDLPVKFGAYQNYNGGGMNGAIQSEFIADFRVLSLGRGEKRPVIARKLNECLAIFESKLEQLWREYNEVQEDEYLIENMKENDLEFTGDGVIYNG